MHMRMFSGFSLFKTHKIGKIMSYPAGFDPILLCYQSSTPSTEIF